MNLNVTADGPGKGMFRYQWKKRGSNSLPDAVMGKDTSKITINSVKLSDRGSYYCVILNQWENVTKSNNATVTVLGKL